MRLLMLGTAVLAMSVATGGAQDQQPFRIYVTAETVDADGFALVAKEAKGRAASSWFVVTSR